MSGKDWDRLELLFEQASRLPLDQRSAFVERESAGDFALRAELVALLEASGGAEAYFGWLREELLGPDVQGVLRGVAEAGDAPDPWIGRTVAHYEIRERIGGGGMGVVYRAHDSRLDRPVALKFIAPEIRSDLRAQERFLKEARAASALDHPNICTIHEIGETGAGRQFIVMPVYAGETLRSRLGRPPVPPGEALELARQIAQALAAAHERGIVHRDVKPDNVFITRDGVVKLLDFGLAHSTDHRMSGPAAALGTVAYMSPEQAAGQRADARSDVWALGVILFELLAGTRPFAGSDPRAVLDHIARGEPDFGKLSGAEAPLLVATVRRALAKDPAKRIAHGGEFLAALTDRTPIPAAPRLRPIPIAVGVLVTLGLGGLGAASLLRVRGEPDRPTPLAPPGSAGVAMWVDDNPENNAEVIRQLERRGVQVETALSTADAVRRFDPAVHRLIVSDMGRFEGEGGAYVEQAGLDLLARLRARHPEVQVVFCTSARAAQTYRPQALAAGARAVLEDCAAVIDVLGLADSAQGPPARP